MNKSNTISSFAIFSLINLKKGNGGPSGYLFNLRESLYRTNDKIKFILPNEEKHSIPHSIIRFLANLIPIRTLRHKIKTWLNEQHIVRSIAKERGLKYIMCHSCEDLYYIHKLLKKHPLKQLQPNWVLMSHSPTFPSVEMLEAYRYTPPRCAVNVAPLIEIENEAFKLAHIVVAPSPNSMNAYLNERPYLFKDKTFYYIPTGCKALPHHNKRGLREKFQIHTKFVICYVGRHWNIKGYDILIEIAKVILKTRDDVSFLIAGKINPTIPPLQHPRWIELGQTDPSEVFCCADAFVMPSRESYFDLVIPEALSVGLKCILANVGGNRDFKALLPEISLFNHKEGAISEINLFLSLSDKSREDIKKDILFRYNNLLTEKNFAENYLNFARHLDSKNLI